MRRAPSLDFNWTVNCFTCRYLCTNWWVDRCIIVPMFTCLLDNYRTCSCDLFLNFARHWAPWCIPGNLWLWISTVLFRANLFCLIWVVGPRKSLIRGKLTANLSRMYSTPYCGSSVGEQVVHVGELRAVAVFFKFSVNPNVSQNQRACWMNDLQSDSLRLCWRGDKLCPQKNTWSCTDNFR